MHASLPRHFTLKAEQVLEIFPWNDNFATGIEEIDLQHRRLIELLNILVAHLAYQRDAPSIDEIIGELKDYAAVHFATEEAIWASYFSGDSWEEWHRNAHVEFVDKIVDLIAESSGKAFDEVIEDVVSFLTHWLALHIIESDKRMAKVVLALPSGISLEKAKEMANQEMSGSTRVLIDTVMGMYDNLAFRTIQLTREINARIKSEEALKAAQDDLIRMKDEAVDSERRAAREIRNFAYVMSHHLQEPVRQQLVFTSKVKKDLGEAAARDMGIRESLDHIVLGGERLRMLLNDMQTHLALSHSPWTPKRASVGDALDQAVHRLRGKIRETTALIEHGVLPIASVDALRLTDIFTALLDNSMTFRRDGIPPLVHIDCAASPSHLEFAVEDNGIGIPEDMRERVFGVFERLHPQIVASGTGIGLAMVKKIVESASGRVWIENTDLGGVKVRFTIPVHSRV